jgi:hypothetical protein
VLITYVPEPSMIAIVITGLASVVVCGARRRGAG